MRKRNPRIKKQHGVLPELPEWKRKALTLFPDLRDDFDNDDTTIYTVFFALLSRCQAAHKNGDVRFQLPHIYAFAAWCFRQEENDLSNAVGVAFYEHLADEAETLEAIPQWLEPEIFEDVSGAWWRLSESDYQQLQERYKRLHQTAT